MINKKFVIILITLSLTILAFFSLRKTKKEIDPLKEIVTALLDVEKYIEIEDYANALSTLEPVFDKYVRNPYERGDSELLGQIGFAPVQEVCLYTALVTILGKGELDEKFYYYSESTTLMLSMIWNKSWFETFDDFVYRHENLFKNRSDKLLDLYILASQISIYSGDIERQIKFLEMAERIDGTRYYVLFALARYWNSMEEFTKSEIYFRKIIDINPDDAGALSSIAANLNLLGKHEDALVYVSKALELEPNNFGIRINYAIMLYSNGNSADAKLFNDETISMFPDIKDQLELLSLYFLLDLGLYQEAMIIAEKYTDDQINEEMMATTAALISLAYAFNGDEFKAKQIVRNIIDKWPRTLDKDFVRLRWSFRDEIFDKYFEIVDKSQKSETYQE